MHVCRIIGTTAKKFATQQELSLYTRKTGNRFPKKKAYSTGLLRNLLREIDGRYYGVRGLSEEAKRQKREEQKERKRQKKARERQEKERERQESDFIQKICDLQI